MSNVPHEISPVNLFQAIESRIAAGSPFGSARAALAGGEAVATYDQISLSLIIIKSTLYLRAATAHQFLGSIEIAERQGRGQYRLLVNEREFNGWLASATNLVEMPVEDLPAPQDPIDALVEELKVEFSEHGKRFSDRLDRAAELYRSGYREFPEYGTGFQPHKIPVTRLCGCPDAQFRTLWVANLGHCCKHTLCQLIWDRLDQAARQTQTRRLESQLDAARARAARQNALPVWAGNRGSIEEALGY